MQGQGVSTRANFEDHEGNKVTAAMCESVQMLNVEVYRESVGSTVAVLGKAIHRTNPEN